MPAQLNDEVAKLSQAFATLRQRLDRDSVKELAEQVFSLRKLLKEILGRDLLDVLKNDTELSDTRLKAWEELSPEGKRGLLKKVSESVIIQESTELSKFFENVSNAVIEAQKELNKRSKQYIAQLEEENSPIPPTFFAIPSLKAEMKLGVSEITSEGINVILFKNEQQQQRFFESAVTFELVSTPPAPATRPKEEKKEEAARSGPRGPEVALESVRPEEFIELESVSPIRRAELESRLADEEVRSRIDELTLELDEAKAAMIAVTETLVEETRSEKPKTRKRKRTAKKSTRKTKKPAAKKSRTTKTKKSKR